MFDSRSVFLKKNFRQQLFKVNFNFVTFKDTGHLFKGTVSRKSWRDECMGH
jgi:hypothetical protein